MKKFILGLGALPLIASLALLLSGHGYIFTALSRTYLAGHATANIDDHTVFDTHTIASGEPEAWPVHPASPRAGRCMFAVTRRAAGALRPRFSCVTGKSPAGK